MVINLNVDLNFTLLDCDLTCLPTIQYRLKERMESEARNT